MREDDKCKLNIGAIVNITIMPKILVGNNTMQENLQI